MKNIDEAEDIVQDVFVKFMRAKNFKDDELVELKPNYRNVLYLYYCEGYTTLEIAELLKNGNSGFCFCSAL